MAPSHQEVNLELRAGWFCIGASMLQPVYNEIPNKLIYEAYTFDTYSYHPLPPKRYNPLHQEVNLE